jgi:hypothetical protein
MQQSELREADIHILATATEYTVFIDMPLEVIVNAPELTAGPFLDSLRIPTAGANSFTVFVVAVVVAVREREGRGLRIRGNAS